MRKKFTQIPIILGILLIGLVPIIVYAADARAHFGSAYYEKEEGKTFDIGVYISAAEWIGQYQLEVGYDPSILEYVGGGAADNGGVVIVAGVADGEEAKNMLSFRAKRKGVSSLLIANAVALDAEGNSFVIEYQEPTTVTVFEKLQHLEGIRINGEELTVFEEETLEYELLVEAGTEKLDIQGIGADIVVSDTNLDAEENTITFTVNSNTATPTTYTLYVKVKQVEEALILEDEDTELEDIEETAEDTETEDTSLIETKQDALDIIADGSSTSGYLASILKQKVVWIPLVSLVVLVFVINGIVVYVEYRQDKALEERKILAQKKREVRKKDREELEFVDIADLDMEYINYEEPVITVEDLCMDFKIATQNVSGIKEWLIEKIKGRMSYRLLHALNHVSFEVYPGEVVGIIGTNGSGKSTLLKIVSGVLSPTSGRVIVDRSKVQLLTLGTGFDMELTARENVYLNGAIIGYSREFIDEHYDDIVEFAELQDFMEEKVKNFSSGMVSRLGFAIATAGDAAEILILDEVLSVGDEFFRKKSLKRVQEMIHGGSTVLMVSHSMDTIVKNCNKVVWIEKGKMKMVGDAKEVCDEYENSVDLGYI